MYYIIIKQKERMRKMKYFIIYLILFIYIAALFFEFKKAIFKNKLLIAIVKNKKIEFAKNKSLDLNNDYDFIKLLTLIEYSEKGKEMYSNPSSEMITCAKILEEKKLSKEEHHIFLKEKRKEIIAKIKTENGKYLLRIIIFSIVIIFNILIIFKIA